MVAQGFDSLGSSESKSHTMPFLKNIPPWKLNKVLKQPNNSHLYEKKENAVQEIEYWTEWLQKPSLTVEQQRKCLHLIEGAELELEKILSTIKSIK